MAPASVATPLVRIDGVSKTYREAGTATPVLNGVTLDLHRDEAASLVGPSGCGKTTLLSLIAGLLAPDAGSITFDGRDVTALGETGRACLRASRIGVVLQGGNLLPFLTAAENVELALDLGGVRRARSRARQLLAELGVADRAHHLPRRLSGGEAQRVAVAVALANEPDLLLADEATGELDSATAQDVVGSILGVGGRRGLSVLFVTHSPALASRTARRLCLAGGQVREAP